MICPSCGRQVGEHDLFCTQCGASLLQARSMLDEEPPAAEQEYLETETRGSFRDPEVPAYRRSAVSGAAGSAGRPGRSSLSPEAFSSVPQEQEKPRGSIASLLLMITGFILIALLTFVLLRMIFGDGSEAEILNGEPNAVETQLPAAVTPENAVTPGPLPSVVIPSAVPTAEPTSAPAPTPSPAPAQEYLLPDSATRYLTDADLAGLTHEQLCLARNEIYARHGRLFSTPQIAAYFAAKSWYKGTIAPGSFDSALLNAYERANIQLISDYETKNYGGSYY